MPRMTPDRIPKPTPPRAEIAPPYTPQGALKASLQRAWIRNPDAVTDWEARYIARISGWNGALSEGQLRLASHILTRLEKLDPGCRVEATIVLTPHAGGQQ